MDSRAEFAYIMNLTKANNVLKLKVQQLKDSRREPIEELEIVPVANQQEALVVQGEGGKHCHVWFNKENNINHRGDEDGHHKPKKNLEWRPYDA
jgi:hypothetical protein